MNSLFVHRLIKAFPFAMTAFTVLMLMHGFNVNGFGFGGHGAYGAHFTHSSGDPGGPGEPSIHMLMNGDPGGPGEPS